MKAQFLKVFKISAIVVASLFVLYLSLLFGINNLLHNRIEQRLMEQVQILYGRTIRYGAIYINPISSTVTINDLYFNNVSCDSLAADSLGFEVSVEQVRVLHLGLLDVLRKRGVDIRAITISGPQMRLNLSEELLSMTPEEDLPLRDEDVSVSLNAGERMLAYVARLNVEKLRIEDASIRWRMLDSYLAFDVDTVNLAVDNLGFDFITQTASYNDSTYTVSIRGAHILTPDSLTYLEVGQFDTKDAGPICIKDFTERSTVAYRELADRSHLPETWTSIVVEQVETSPINIIHQVLNQKVNIDTLHVRVNSLTVFEDHRYLPKEPYIMPQEILMAVEVPLHVDYLRASVDTLHYTLALTDTHDGSFDLVRIKARVKNFGNRNRDEFRVIGSTEFMGGGRADLQLTMKMNRACDWSIKMSGKGLRGSSFDGFLRPLFGLTADLDIDEVETAYKGDKDMAAGDFKMLYHGLEIHTYAGESAFDIINKNAKVIENLGNAFLPKTNPTLLPGSKGNLPSERPREYDVKATRDPMKKVPIYMLSPLIDGIKKTMLPGLYIQKRKHKSSASKQK